MKAILGRPNLMQAGRWQLLKPETIGYLDQHYANLTPEKTIYQTIADIVPTWAPSQVRKHLNDFLFRKNEEVDTPTRLLSGAEKARLSLAKIAALLPELLILDEITNNIDLEIREHIVQVLKAYPGL